MTDTTDAVDSAVNLGKTAWDIIKDGKPVASAKSSICNAIPKGSKPGDLAGWKNFSGTWPIKTVNGFGMTMVDIEMAWSFWGKGALKEKAGVFVNDFTVYAKKCDLEWTSNATIAASVQGTPMNVGSHDKPIFSIMLLVTATYGGFLDTFHKTWRVRACGDGKLIRK